eukprot:TRINITY_DN4876_c0_g1_i1.p1 TRINITY_DN4876_c0_g1~~TRINITY_DN4876_c0_g1_i1.p1  ORF type:complete len:768 (-),score=163.29 TRINITY_DN4876_c0_g1_i1:228-2531(-)
MEINPATVEKSEKQNETPSAEKQITEEDVTSTKDVAAGDASNNNKSGYYQKKRPYNPAHKRYAIPWVTKFPMALHEEIWSFSQWLTPTTEEQTMRQDVVNRLRKIVEKLWPAATVVPYGSFETNLCVPTSDIDVVIFGAQPIDDKSPLSILAEALEQEELPSKPPKVISSAKVPIVKFHDRKSGCLVDISFDITTGIANTKIIKEFLNQYPLLRPLALVIKFYLKQRYLNDTWSGGIGSYTLIMMIISYLQLHTKSKGQIPNPAEANNTNNNNNNVNNNNNNVVPAPHDETKEDMASMLTGFFELYGSKFDYLTNVISILDGGKYFSKEEKKWTHSDALDALAVEDPQNPDNDVGLACFKIKEAKQAFAEAFATLTGPKKYLSESLLGKLVRVPLSLVQQRQRMKSSGNRELTDETPQPEAVIETQSDLDTEEKRLTYNYQNRYKSYSRNNDGWYHNKTPSSNNTNHQSSHRAETGTDSSSTTQRTSNNNNNTTQSQSYLPPHRRQQQARAPAPANTNSTASSTVSSTSTSPTNSTLSAMSVPLLMPALNDKTATHGSNNNNNRSTQQRKGSHQNTTTNTHHAPRNNNAHHLTTHKTSNSTHQNNTSHSPASTSPRVTSSNNPSNTPVHSGHNNNNNSSNNNRQNNSGQNRSGANNNNRSNNRNNNNNNRGRSNNNTHNNNANVHEDDEIKNDEQNFPSLSKDPTVHENKIAQKASDTVPTPNSRPQHVNNNTINGNNAAGQQNGTNKGTDGKKGGKRRQNTVLISA